MNCGGVNDLLALRDLLENCNKEDINDNANGEKIETPSSIVDSRALAKSLPLVKPKIGAINTANTTKDIWEENEIPNEEDIEDFEDTRERPKFEILYKQDVMTEDVFLGMGDKDPSTFHCDSLIYRIHFPNHQMKDIELEVTKKKLLCQSSKLKLSIYLPHPVKFDEGNAKWDSANEYLVVTLPIIRDEW